jgi:hypothetical protein
VQATTLLSSLQNISEHLGQALGYDLVRLFDITPNVRYAYMVVRYERQPLYARFLVYRPAREWQVNGVLWNTDASVVFPASLMTPP